jgi:hypothetical protein
MKKQVILGLAAAASLFVPCASSAAADQTASAPKRLARPVEKNVPALDAAAIKAHREDVVRLFREKEYGVRPVERPADLRFETAPDRLVFGGNGVHRKVTISATGPRGPFSFVANAYLPRGAKKAPGFLYIFIGQRVSGEKFQEDSENPVAWSFPVTSVLARGYAAISFNNFQVALDDRKKCFETGVFKAWGPSEAERKPTDWAAIDAWAWGASRVMDWIETQADIDATRIAVIGHSRGGKASLWAAATDTRFALACVNDSGCSGAKLNHVVLPESETIRIITTAFPHWFCPAYRAFVDKEFEMTFDQHQLVACIAPRLVSVHSATGDDWAGQAGEYLSCLYASPAWEAYGLKGLVAPAGEMPAAGVPLYGGRVGYYLRDGKHDLNALDWKEHLDFADRWWKRD